MRRWLLIAMLCSAGCGSSDDDLGRTVEIDVTSDQPLDQIEVFASTLLAGTGPITPGRLARGDLASEPARIGAALSWGRDCGGSRACHLDIDSFFLPDDLIAIGYRRDAGGDLQVVSAGDVVDHAATLTAQRAAQVEVWGGASGHCVRFADSTPRYFVRGGDADCDGLGLDVDCDDLDHCDLDAPTEAARAGCVTDLCQPCLDDTPGSCSIGSHTVCRDEVGSAAYTCDSDPACGESTCLSEGSCGPGLSCRKDWPDTDPRECLRFRWAQGAAATESIICDLPAGHGEHSTTDPLICQPSSIVEAALPYAACTNPRVVIGTTYETTTVSIAPPCTLRIVLTPTDRVVITDRPVVVTFDTDAATVTARFQLVPKLDTCATISTCTVIPGAGVCEP